MSNIRSCSPIASISSLSPLLIMSQTNTRKLFLLGKSYPESAWPGNRSFAWHWHCSNPVVMSMLSTWSCTDHASSLNSAHFASPSRTTTLNSGSPPDHLRSQHYVGNRSPLTSSPPSTINPKPSSLPLPVPQKSVPKISCNRARSTT